MKSVRRPAVALGTMLVLVLIQAIADPTGLLALVGWSGALPQLDAGSGRSPRTWSTCPCCSASCGGSAVRAGDRYWTLVAGVVLAVMLAQAAACLVMTWDLAIAGWAAGYVTAKAVPAALIVAAFDALVRRQDRARAPRARRDLASGCAVRRRRAAARRPVVDRRRSTHPAFRPRGRIAASSRSSWRWCSSPARPRSACGGCALACPACSAAGSRRSSRAASWASSRRSSSSWSTGSRATSGRSWPPTSPSPTASRSARASAGSSA